MTPVEFNRMDASIRAALVEYFLHRRTEITSRDMVPEANVEGMTRIINALLGYGHTVAYFSDYFCRWEEILARLALAGYNVPDSVALDIGRMYAEQ